MASRPTDSMPVTGRVDSEGRLVAADAALEQLQVDAGSALGRPLALPQLAALARAAASLRVPLSRSLLAADANHDIDLFVRAEPNGDSVDLIIERWAARQAAGPKLSLVETAIDSDPGPEAVAAPGFSTDPFLNITDVSPSLASLAGREPDECLGVPLTALFQLIENADGTMPLLAAAAGRSAVDGQRAAVRGGSGAEIIIDAEPEFDERNQFQGFRAVLREEGPVLAPRLPVPGLDESLDQALRTPLDRIIAGADRIVERSDGPLRSDYASYAGDIAAAARHLLSVIRGMGQAEAVPETQIDLVALAEEAAGLVEPHAEQRGVKVRTLPTAGKFAAAGEERAVVQILVNIIGNAVRHSPPGSSVDIGFERNSAAGICSVTVTDNGPGIAEADQARIFERYEQAGGSSEGAGLGLAISRRLAGALGGEILLRSAPGEGSSFTLQLPAA